MADELSKLAALHEAGALTEAEYRRAKTRVLGGVEEPAGGEPSVRQAQGTAEAREESAGPRGRDGDGGVSPHVDGDDRPPTLDSGREEPPLGAVAGWVVGAVVIASATVAVILASGANGAMTLITWLVLAPVVTGFAYAAGRWNRWLLLPIGVLFLTNCAPLPLVLLAYWVGSNHDGENEGTLARSSAFVALSTVASLSFPVLIVLLASQRQSNVRWSELGVWKGAADGTWVEMEDPSLRAVLVPTGGAFGEVPPSDPGTARPPNDYFLPGSYGLFVAFEEGHAPTSVATVRIGDTPLTIRCNRVLETCTVK